MSFNGTEGAPIDLATASKWTKNYQATTSEGEIIAHFFGKDILRDILAQDGCMGIRIYYALDDLGGKQLIIVGANAAENDQIGEGQIVGDASKGCPVNCGDPNVLNNR